MSLVSCHDAFVEHIRNVWHPVSFILNDFEIIFIVTISSGYRVVKGHSISFLAVQQIISFQDLTNDNSWMRKDAL